MSDPVRCYWYPSPAVCWNQGMLARVLGWSSMHFWPPASRFDSWPWPPDQPGGIIIAAGSYVSEHPDRAAEVARYRVGRLLIHTSDEDLLWDSRADWQQHQMTWHQHRSGCPLLIGCHLDTVSLLPELRPLAERQHEWTFSGQVTHPKREEFHEAIQGLGGFVRETGGFAHGVERAAYLAELADARIAPCPSGPMSPDTMRLYEAIEAGCLPVVDRRAHWWPESANFWAHAETDPPFPIISHWREFGAILERYRTDPLALQRTANACGAWWIGYQRRIAYELGGGRGDAVTVLMPSSPIPAHPSTALLEEAIGRTRAYPELATAEIILMLDGVREEQMCRALAYEEYRRRVIRLCQSDPRFRGVLPLMFEAHTHQAAMTREALKLVQTPLVLFQEHDTWPMGAIPWSKLTDACQTADVNMVRLHIFDRVIPEHRPLYAERPLVLYDRAIRLRQTLQWSQRPHLAKTDWYRGIIAEYFRPRDRTMIEDVMHSVVQCSPLREWGIYVYEPEDRLDQETKGWVPDMLRSGTCDGRGEDPKFPMWFEPRTDGPTPEIGGMPGKPQP